MPNKDNKPTKTNRPKDTVKSRAGKASAAARRVKREKGEPIKRPCSARRSNGEPCGNSAIRGGSVCHAHGGLAPQVREKANRRLLMMVEPALKELRRILDDPMSEDKDKLRAISMVLNRTGFAEKQQLDIGLRAPSVWDQLVADGDVFEFDRNELEHLDPAALPGGGGDDLDSMLDEFTDAQERKRARDRSTKLGNDGHDVVPGEVVDDPTPKGAERGREYRGRTTGRGPIKFPATGDPRNRGTELDPDDRGPYERRPSTFDRYEAEE